MTVLVGHLRERRADVAWLVFWSLVQALPSAASGWSMAAATSRFLAGQFGAGLGWLGLYAAAAVAGALGVRQAYLRAGAIVEPLRDNLVGAVVAGALARSTEGTAVAPDTRSVARLTQQAETVRDSCATLLIVTSTFIFSAGSAVAGLVTLVPAALPYVILPLLATGGLLRLLLRPTISRQRAAILAEEEVAEAASRAVSGVRDVTACGAEDRVLAGLASVITQAAATSRATATVGAARTLCLAIGGWLPLLLVLIAAPSLLGHGVSPGDIVGVITYITGTVRVALYTASQGVGTGLVRLYVTLDRIRQTAATPVLPPARSQRAQSQRAQSQRARSQRAQSRGARQRGARSPDAQSPRVPRSPAPGRPRIPAVSGHPMVPAASGRPTVPTASARPTVPMEATRSTVPTPTVPTPIVPTEAARPTVPTPRPPTQRPPTPHPATQRRPTQRRPTERPPRREPHAAGKIELRNVRFGYGPHAAPVIDRLSLRIPPGDHLAIAGPSGIGKSSLAALIAGTLHPNAGAVLLGGVPVASRGRDWRVLLPQEAYVFAGTLRENLAYYHGDATEPELDKAAGEVGLGPLLSRLGGYDADVTPSALSAGERQLIALTRAYLSPAPVAILDEATCYLDPAAERRAEEAFARRGGTLIVIAHRITSARRAKRILVLDGVRARIGNHASLLTASPMYRDLAGYWDGPTSLEPEREPRAAASSRRNRS